MIKSFDHVNIFVKDFDKMIDWYVKNMGFSVKRRIENKERGRKTAFLEAGGQAMLEFSAFIDPGKAVDGPVLKAEETGIKHISFFVDNVVEMHQKLKNAGVEFTTFAPERGVAVFKDPNGIVLEIRLL